MDFGWVWLILVDFGGFRWILVDFGVFWWILLDFGGFWWILMDCGGFCWIVVDFGVGGGTLGTQRRGLLQTRGLPEQNLADLPSIVAAILAPWSMFLDRGGDSVF